MMTMMTTVIMLTTSFSKLIAFQHYSILFMRDDFSENSKNCLVGQVVPKSNQLKLF